MIPWTLWGNGPGGLGISIPAVNQVENTIAFGYNNASADETVHAFRWRNQADPFTIQVDPATGFNSSVDAWGSIKFAGSILEAWNDPPVPAPCNCSAAGIVSPVANTVASNRTILRTEYFYLNGQAITLGSAARSSSNAAVFQRFVYDNKTTTVCKVPMSAVVR